MRNCFALLQGKQDEFSVQVDRNYGIDRSAIVRISTNSMQTPTKTPPPAVKVKVAPDFVDFSELPPAETPTFSKVLMTYDITELSLKTFNDFLLHKKIDYDTQRPDGVLYLRNNGRKRHLAAHKVMFNVSINLLVCELSCLYVQEIPQVMADKHNGFVDNRGIKALSKRADCGWIMDLHVIDSQTFRSLNEPISAKFPKDSELRRARLPDIVYLTTEGKTRMANASLQNDSVKFITSEPDEYCFLLECHDSVQYVVDEKDIVKYSALSEWFAFAKRFPSTKTTQPQRLVLAARRKIKPETNVSFFLIWYSGGLRDELGNIVAAPKSDVTAKLGGYDETWSAADFESRTPESQRVQKS